MTAIIKNRFRVQNAKDFLENLYWHPRGARSVEQTQRQFNYNPLSGQNSQITFSYTPREDISNTSPDSVKESDFLSGVKKALGGHVIDRNHYLFIGKPLRWTQPSIPGAEPELSPAPPTDNYFEECRVWDEMLSLKRLTDVDASLVVPRVDWDSSGNTVYDKYDDNPHRELEIISRRRFYVLNDDYDVFVCIQNNNGGPSINKPIRPLDPTTLVDYTSEGQDGYIWKYMYSLGPNDVKKFLTDSWIPVKTLGDIPAPAQGELNYNQYMVEQASKNYGGSILSFHIENMGDSYTSTPTVTITTNGDPTVVPSATAVIENQRLVRVEVVNGGKNATFASAVIVGGGYNVQAKVRPILSQKHGLGSDPERDLGAFYVLLNAYVKYEEGAGDFPANNDFRQIGIIRDVIDSSTNKLADKDTLIATKRLRVSSVIGGTNPASGQSDRFFLPDEMLLLNGNPLAVVLEYKPDQADPGSTATVTTGTLTFIQTPESGYTPITTSMTNLTGSNSGAKCNVTEIIPEEVKKHKGDILYLENRRPVLRSPEQVEDIKAIIEF